MGTYVTKQTSLLNVQRDLELRCEALEHAAPGGFSLAAAAQAKLQDSPALEGELEGLGMQGRVKEVLSEVPKFVPGQQSKMSSTPSLQDSRRPSQQILASPSIKPTPSQSPTACATASVTMKSKAPSASEAKTPGRQSLMALLGPGKSAVKLAVPAAKAAAPAKKVAVGKLPTKNA